MLIFLMITMSVQVSVQQDFHEIVSMYIGCFYDSSFNRDLPFEVLNSRGSVKDCTKRCGAKYFMYAGLQNGNRCFCGSSYGKHGPGQCDINCQGDGMKSCGGEKSNTIYHTGFNVPGPPKNVSLEESNTKDLYIEWSEPESSNGVILQYEVFVHLNFSYHPGRRTLAPKHLLFSNTTNTAKVLGLLPGSKYNVSVAAMSKQGLGPAVTAYFWTEIGTPKEPQTPQFIENNDEGTLRVKLFPVGAFYGPITSYLVIVIDETNPVPFNKETLYNFEKAQKEGVHYWIAAELTPDYMETHSEFVVGDRRLYGDYRNEGPLIKNRDYHVTLAAVSTLNGVTKRSFAEVSHEQHLKENLVVFDFHLNTNINHPTVTGTKQHGYSDVPQPASDQSLVVGLSIAIVLASALLVAAIFVFVYLRNSFRARLRRRGDTQELTVHTPSIDLQENGYIDNENSDELRSAECYLDSLRSKIWMIPRNFLEISHEVVGRGKFGSVMKGSVNQGSQFSACNVQVVPSRMLERAERNAMLKDLDTSIKAGSHINLVNLIGICEDQDTLLVVLDSGDVSLKHLLLDSRALDNYPVYAQKNNRFSTAREETLLDLMVGVARGLDHLAKCKILHGQICARTVLVVGGERAKLAGLAMSDCQRGGDKLDMTRWMANEALRSNNFTAKCDIWSLGCLLWEMATLGATPYGNVRTKEVGVRVMRGLRLPQTSHISDDFYQLMLATWMTDSDERPTAAGMAQALAEMAQDGQLHINFAMREGYQYQAYNNDLEMLN